LDDRHPLRPPEPSYLGRRGGDSSTMRGRFRASGRGHGVADDSLGTQQQERPANVSGAGRLTVGIPKEIHPGENRGAAVPRSVPQLLKLGYDVIVESGTGEAAAFLDPAYVEAGARSGPDPAAPCHQPDPGAKSRPPGRNA